MAYLKHGQLSTKTNGTRDGETVRDGVSIAWFDSKRVRKGVREGVGDEVSAVVSLLVRFHS